MQVNPSAAHNIPFPMCPHELWFHRELLQPHCTRQGKKKERFLNAQTIFLPLLKIHSAMETSFSSTQLNVSVLAQMVLLSYVIVKDTELFMWRPRTFFPHS